MTAHILVVDDEPDLEPLIRQRFRRPIRDGDWAFAFAHDGHEALAYVDSGAGVDVVLSDINMPNMDGLTLLTHLSRYEDIKVVMVSAYADMSNIREAMNRGAFDFITKPMNLADLELTIGKTVEHVMTLRQLRDERDAAQDMARLKGEFIANVSHEIRTPMNAILGLSHLALQQPVQDERSVYLRKIRDAGKHLLSIINDILDMSKVGVGKLALDHLPFDLQRVMASTVALVEEPIALKRLALVFRIGPGVPRYYCGDGRRLGQVLLNYVGNAAKFTEAGAITLSVEVEAAQAEGWLLRFVVADTGPGLTAEQMARLFQPFEQSDGSVTRRHGGTGLGLSIAKSLAELMGGTAGVESRPGEGSRFWFTVRLGADAGRATELLPQGEHCQFIADTASATDEQMNAVPDLRGKRILVVEDNALNIDVACDLLAFTGATVEVARNGAQAVGRVDDGGFDLVLMDIQMPVQDGLSATRQIRRDPARRQLPIIAMTGSAMADESSRCIEAGMNDLILKPIEPAKMFEVVQRWLRQAEAAAGAAAEPVAPVVDRPIALAGDAVAAPAWDAFSLRIDGLDVDTGLGGLLGKQSLYLRMLRRFSATQANAAAELRAAWRAGDGVTACRIAHTVKGLCGTVGALRLADDAAALELALTQSAPEADISARLDNFEATLVPMCEALQAALPPA